MTTPNPQKGLKELLRPTEISRREVTFGICAASALLAAPPSAQAVFSSPYSALQRDLPNGFAIIVVARGNEFRLREWISQGARSLPVPAKLAPPYRTFDAHYQLVKRELSRIYGLCPNLIELREDRKSLDGPPWLHGKRVLATLTDQNLVYRKPIRDFVEVSGTITLAG